VGGGVLERWVHGGRARRSKRKGAAVVYTGEEARSGLFIAQRQGDKREEGPVNEFGWREGEIGDGDAFPWADSEVARGDGVARARMASRGGGVAAGALCVARGGGAPRRRGQPSGETSSGGADWRRGGGTPVFSRERRKIETGVVLKFSKLSGA
jgi:hypothetical protein